MRGTVLYGTGDVRFEEVRSATRREALAGSETWYKTFATVCGGSSSIVHLPS